MIKGKSKRYNYRVVKVHYEDGVNGSGDCFALQRTCCIGWFGRANWYDLYWLTTEKACELKMIDHIEHDNRPEIKVTYES